MCTSVHLACAVLVLEPGTLCMLGKYSTPDLTSFIHFHSFRRWLLTRLAQDAVRGEQEGGTCPEPYRMTKAGGRGRAPLYSAQRGVLRESWPNSTGFNPYGALKDELGIDTG